MKKCAFCGSTNNVNFSDPEKGPVCQNCWLNLGQELEDIEEEQKKTASKKHPSERD